MSSQFALQKSVIPFWNEVPEGLLVGIEQERFIFHADGRAPTLDETKALFEYLVDDGFVARKFDGDGRPLAVNQDTIYGYLSIKNDFATHIIEAAFPPISDPLELTTYMDKIWRAITRAANVVDLRISTGALITEIPPCFQLVPHERREWLPNRLVPKEPSLYWHKYFNVLMCSTQVHLNILDRKFYSYLPSFYSHEYLVPLFFSNSRAVGQLEAHCARPLIWRDSFTEDYRAFAIPREFPETPEQYDSFLNGSFDFKRDYSFIAPRTFGSVEFRTACSQDSHERILQLAALRMAMAISATIGGLPKILGAREYFYDVCSFGRRAANINLSTFRALNESASLMPSAWKGYLEPTLKRLKRIT